jgi:hypothetical protein
MDYASAQSDQDPCSTCNRVGKHWSALILIRLRRCAGWPDPCWSQTHYVGFVVTRLKCFISHELHKMSPSQNIYIFVLYDFVTQWAEYLIIFIPVGYRRSKSFIIIVAVNFLFRTYNKLTNIAP